MKKALISGTRICQVATDEFPVHPAMQWISVPDDTTERDTFVNGAVVKEIQPPPQPDQSDIGNIQKHIKAAVLAAAIMSGKTQAQAKAAFKQAWDSLP